MLMMKSMINVYNDDKDKAGDTGPSQCEEDEKKILGSGPLTWG